MEFAVVGGILFLMVILWAGLVIGGGIHRTKPDE